MRAVVVNGLWWVRTVRTVRGWWRVELKDVGGGEVVFGGQWGVVFAAMMVSVIVVCGGVVLVGM